MRVISRQETHQITFGKHREKFCMLLLIIVRFTNNYKKNLELLLLQSDLQKNKDQQVAT